MQQSQTSISTAALNTMENAWILLTLGMFLCWWAHIARRYSDDLSLAERILAAFIFTVCQIVVTTLILGSFGYLYWWQLGIFNLIISLFAGITAITGKGNSLIAEIKLTGKSLAWFLKSSVGIMVIGAISVFISVWVIYVGQLLPPVGYDSWGYHFLWAALAHQNGNIGYDCMFDPIIKVYPWNADILFLWWIIGARTERWADIAQAPFAFASALSCYLLALRAGARKVDAAIAGLLVFSVPTVFHQMWVAYVDLAVMGTTLASLAFLTRRRLTPVAISAAGCAAGFMLGSKGTAAYMFIGILLVLLYRLFPLGFDALSGLRHRFKSALIVLSIFALFVFITGSYFYLRNWIHYGNPFGIYKIQLGQFMIFKGEIDPTTNFARTQFYGPLFDALHSRHWATVFDGFFDPQTIFIYDHRIGGWGAVWTVLMMPAILVAFVWSVMKKKWSVPAIILACIIPYILFKWDHTNTRYHLQLIGAGTTSFAFLLSMLRRTKWRRPLIAMAGAMMLLTVFIAGVSIIDPGMIRKCRQAPYRMRDRNILFSSWNDPRFADTLEQVKQPGMTLAFTRHLPQHKNLAFWNNDFSNRAVMVWWGGEFTYDRWLSAVVESNADAVYVPPESPEMTFCQTRPDVLEQLYAGSQGGIFKVKQ